jgi:hypothetical protein
MEKFTITMTAAAAGLGTSMPISARAARTRAPWNGVAAACTAAHGTKAVAAPAVAVIDRAQRTPEGPPV